jgi:hypothetical protein
MGSDISKIRKNNYSNHRSNKKPYQDERLDISTIRGEIRELAGTALQGKNKNQWKERNLTSLGAVEEKGIKTPFKILMGMKKAQKHREEIRNRRTQEAFGFDVARQLKKRQDAQDEEKKFLNQLRGNRRGDRNTVGDGSFGYQDNVGQSRGGMLVFSQRDRSHVEGPRNPRPTQGGVTKKKSSGYNRQGGYGKKSKAKMRNRR